MKEVNVLSFGAGVQSTALALLSGNQKTSIPVFDFGIFSDTGAEPDSVYDCLEKVKKHASFPIITAIHKKGLKHSIHEAKQTGSGFVGVPFFTKKENGSIGMLRRQCTNHYKIQPVHKEIRKQLGYTKGQHVKHTVNVFIGISRDEMTRMTTPQHKWMNHVYPLVQMEWTRSHCLDFLKKEWKHKVGKSSCTFCPYHDNQAWREMKNNDPNSWNEALMIDETIRNGFQHTKESLYLHRLGVPLKTIDFDAILARQDDQIDFGFQEECEGMCGL